MTEPKKNEVVVVSGAGGDGMSLPVTQQDVDMLKKQRALLKKFISDELKEGIDNDYGKIPGTPKKSLLKPGSEKLARLFKLGVRIKQTEKLIDRYDNFAMFTYKAEIYPLSNPGVIIAECEACVNSQEKKYREKSVYENGRAVYENGEPKKVAVEICDILNTLMKMCQKRAIVGAVILAVAGSDFFSQDIDDASDADQLGANGRPDPKRAQAAAPKPTAARSTQMGPSNGNGQRAQAAAPMNDTSSAGNFVLTFGRDQGKRLNEIGERGMGELREWIDGIPDGPKGKAKVCADALLAYEQELADLNQNYSQ